MKNKIIMSITLGLVCFALVYVMYIQFKTVRETDLIALETMRETELRTELVSWKTKYEEASKKYDETSLKIQEYNDAISTSKESSVILQEELMQANMLFGTTQVTGEGVIVILQDTEEKSITDIDLLLLLNELRVAGAEAISINGQRICPMTEIRTVYNFIFVNGERITSPYTVKAIGNSNYLESGLTIKGGYVDETKILGEKIDITKENNILIERYDGQIKIDYLEIMKDE